MTVLEVLVAYGPTFETTRESDRVTVIIWRKAIPLKAVAEFVFRARDAGSGEIVWNADQHFADDTIADWVGARIEHRPDAVTK